MSLDNKSDILVTNVEDGDNKTTSASGIRPEILEQDQKLARRLLWKIDLWILPMLTILYLLTAMDRSDIGNAQVAGMQQSIGATPSEWAKVVSLFYVGFIVGQPFGAWFLRMMTPPILFGVGVTLWSVAVCEERKEKDSLPVSCSLVVICLF